MSFSRRRIGAGSALAALAAAATLTGPALAAPALAATTPAYKVTIIRNPGSFQNVRLISINNTGDIVGTGLESGAQTEEAFLLKAGSATVQFLGSPGDPKNTQSSAEPEGMNNSADVVGLVLNIQQGHDVPVEWPSSVTPTSLGGLTGQPAQASGINDSNEIVGYTEIHGRKPYLIQNGKVTALPVLPNGGFDARALAVNSKGVIVGDGDTSTVGNRAVQWSSSGVITQLAQLPDTSTSQALAVNSSGVAVGDAILTTDDDAHAVMWANGKITDLNAPLTGGGDAIANAINTGGVIVGQGGGNGDGFVYRNGVATDLNTLIAPTSGLTLLAATGVNDSGHIVGDATLNGQDVGYELTPVS
jgi:uncharacterized membrane protein